MDTPPGGCNDDGEAAEIFNPPLTASNVVLEKPTNDKPPPTFDRSPSPDPEDTDTDPPSPPSPPAKDSDPPSCSKLELEPADSAILPDLPKSEAPDEMMMDPLWPDPALPEPNTKSPVDASASFVLATNEPLDCIELDPVANLIFPP